MTTTEYSERRRSLMSLMDERSIAIVPSATEKTRSRDVNFPFRQDSDFQYLSGFPEPESVLVLVPGRPAGEYILFCRPRDPEMETWNGRRAGQEGALERYGADEAHTISQLDELLPGYLEDRDRVYYAVGLSPELDQRMMGWVNQVRAKARAGVTAPREFVSLDHILHERRLLKSEFELSTMRRAASIAAQAHCRAMAMCRPGMSEHELEAEILYVFRQHGCPPAYPSIVGGGENGCILHYTENCDPLQDGDLVLIDAGAEYCCYASDITRTFPVNGRMSSAQQAIYEVVLSAQQGAIDEVQVGSLWSAPHDHSVRALTQGLVDLGLLEGSVDGLIESGAYKRFYMHRIGHWLGMDVHDVGEYKVAGEWRAYQSNMVTTIEPGLYIAPGSEGVDERWWGIGVRIEDDVVVTASGPEVITDGVPKTVEQMQQQVGSGA